MNAKGAFKGNVMSDDLHSKILKQIEVLEARQKHLSKVVEVSKGLDEILAGYQSINFDLEQRFLANIAAFENFSPEIAKAFHNYRPQVFSLELTEKALNVFDPRSETFIFPGNDGVKFGFERFHHYRFRAEKSSYMLNSIIPVKEEQFIHVDHLNNLILKTNELLDTKNFDYQFNRVPEYVNAFVSFGVGLGTHLEELVKYHDVMNLYIMEPNLDLFFFSLFTTDWAMILKTLGEKDARIQLSLGEADTRKLYEELMELMKDAGRYNAANSYFYRAYDSEFLNECYRYFDAQLHENLIGVGFFDDGILSMGHQQASLAHPVPLLKNKSQAFKYQNTPVFLIANGPSLDSSIEIIKKSHDDAIIVTCGTALTAFYRYGIKPDLHIELERTRITNTIISAINDPDYLKEIPLATVNTVHPEVYKHFQRSFTTLKANEPGTTLFSIAANEKKPFAELVHCNPTVANLGLAILLQLGFRNIYLMGSDLGFPEGKHHSGKSIYFSEEGEDKQHYNVKKHDKFQVPVPGNFGDTVITEPFFNISRMEMEKLIAMYPDSKIKNCSDGVFIEGTSPLRPDDIALDKALDKAPLMDHMFQKAVTPIKTDTLDAIQTALSQPQFELLVNDITGLLREPVETRREAMEVMEKVYNHLRGFIGTRYQHFYELLNGSTIGYFARIVQLLLVPHDEKVGLEYYQEGLQFYLSFLEAANKQYQEEPFRVDDYLWVLWKMDKKGKDAE